MQGRHPGGRSELPQPRTTFIGRANERSAVLETLRDRRSVTIVGPGGCGKSRLAIEVAAAFEPVLFVDLSAGAGKRAVMEIAAALGSADSDPVVAALEWAGHGEALLVLDNCEHVIEEVASFALALLATTPNARILATSRAPLGIEGERQFALPPMASPDPHALPALDAVLRFEAIELFLERARAVAPFELTGSNARAVAEICRRLDGLPLAIELAAARASILTPAQIAERLSARFELLTKGSREAIERHRTLRAALDWSYGLLTPPERAAFRDLALFPASFDLAAAEAVCVPGSGTVLDVLDALVEQSLVVADTSGGTGRYRLLETVREYAREQLGDRADAARARLVGYIVELVEAHSDSSKTSDPARSSAIVAAERETIEHVLDLTLHPGPHVASGIRMCRAMLPAWESMNLKATIAYWTERALSVAGDDRGVELVPILYWAANAAAHRSEHERALVLGRRAIELAERAGDERMVWEALSTSGWNAWLAADYERARELIERALDIARRRDDPAQIGYNLASLAWVERRAGSFESSVRLKNESLAMYRRLGDEEQLMTQLQGFANLIGQDDPATARRYLDEAAMLARKRGDTGVLSNVLALLAKKARQAGDDGEAAARYLEALDIARSIGSHELIGWACIGLAEIHESRGDLASAIDMVGQGTDAFRDGGQLRGLADSLIYRAELAERIGDPAQASRSLEEALGRVLGLPTYLRLTLDATARTLARADDLESAAALYGAMRSTGTAHAPVARTHLDTQTRDRVRARLGKERFEELAREGEGLAGPDLLALATGSLRRALTKLRPVAEPVPGEAVFRPDGDVWLVRYGGSDARLRDTKGMRYLATLIASPDREIHVVDLVAAAEGNGLLASEGTDEVTDARSRHIYRARIAELQAEFEEAIAWSDHARAEKARTELDALTDQLSAAYGLSGRARRTASSGERMRKSVWNRVRDAIKRIEEHNPALAKHLEASVRTGTFCSYRPEQAPSWNR